MRIRGKAGPREDAALERIPTDLVRDCAAAAKAEDWPLALKLRVIFALDQARLDGARVGVVAELLSLAGGDRPPTHRWRRELIDKLAAVDDFLAEMPKRGRRW